MFTLASFGSSRTLGAIAEAASEAGYSITLIPIADPSPEQVSAAFSRLDEQAVDGILIVIDAHVLDEAAIVMPPGLPVAILASGARADLATFDADQNLGATLVTRHLLDLGHRTVHHIGGPAISYPAIHREEAWRAELTRVGAPVPPVLHGDWTAESGYRIGRELADDPSVTAIFASNDQMALGVLRALHSRGIDVPGRISVAGFDDMEESANFWPPLTTVRQNFTEIGRRSVTVLLELIRSGLKPPVFETIPTTLMVRESTAPPPA
jgi:DNA-binding LacI/PurR family transcriptional regulator